MADKENNVMVGALMLIAGGIVGAGIALLMAPQSGEETRRFICRYARKTQEKAEDAVHEFADTISEMAETVGEKASEIMEMGKDATRDVKDDLLNMIEEGQEKLEKQRRKLAKIFG